MDSNLVKYLSDLGFAELDIKLLTKMEPMLNKITYTYALANIALVVNKGYPQDDIDSLIYANPSFLVSLPETLAINLNNISGDIEEQLKNDPFLI